MTDHRAEIKRALANSDDSQATVMALLAIAEELAELVAITSALVIDRTREVAR